MKHLYKSLFLMMLILLAFAAEAQPPNSFNLNPDKKTDLGPDLNEINTSINLSFVDTSAINGYKLAIEKLEGDKIENAIRKLKLNEAQSKDQIKGLEDQKKAIDSLIKHNQALLKIAEQYKKLLKENYKKEEEKLESNLKKIDSILLVVHLDFDKFKENKIKDKKLKELELKINTPLVKKLDTISLQFRKVVLEYSKIVSEDNVDEKIIKDKLSLANSLINEFNKVKKELILDAETDQEKEQQLGFQPQLLVGNNGIVVPTLNLLGSRKVEEENIGRIHNIQLFISPIAADTAFTKNNKKLWIPETANMGIHYQFIQTIKNPNPSVDAKKLSMVMDFYYLSRNIPKKDSLENSSGTVNFSNLHVKGGLNYIFLNNALSFRGSYNLVVPMSGINNFENYFNATNKNYGFFEAGLNAVLFLKESSTDLIDLSLSFIVLNKSINKIVNTSDKVIPTISVSYRKSFSIN